jgi:hypothetical protein
MKRLLVIIATLSLIIFNVPLHLINAETNSDAETANSILHKIESIENVDLSLEDYSVLYDIELNPSYLLIDFNHGYAIISRENSVISEYTLNEDIAVYADNVDQIPVYGGPLNYFCVDKSSVLRKTLSIDVPDELISLNQNFLSLKSRSNLSVLSTSNNSFIGLPESRFAKYGSAGSKWLNISANYPASQGYPQNGICGTITSAVLLSYYDDYVNDGIVPSSVRPKYSTSPGTLIDILYEDIDRLCPNGTLPYNLYSGIYQFLEEEANNLLSTYTPHYGNFTTFSTAKTVINRDRPILIGLLELWGSNLGNHWVVAYQYYDTTGTENDMYKVCNNQVPEGSISANTSLNIQVSWSEGLVYLSN